MNLNLYLLSQFYDTLSDIRILDFTLQHMAITEEKHEKNAEYKQIEWNTFIKHIQHTANAYSYLS